ncbi:hypothetical protein DCS_05206 [Drechmeria coniospora]|uniref:GRF-type domain-containing protein n=1 Tax=Drechmeria coniospora TaxID=98403 RepID=A0A151GM59_DRECN|nr:hypothetical protein DCS_05206 [Drechmeria coniospora]KYK58193.1 hypothetical protein DCS_05206 [Drechmeria coniospora]
MPSETVVTRTRRRGRKNTRRNRSTRPELDTPASLEKLTDGLSLDGHCWCNCEPCKRAVLREVKKDGPNRGKFFYTCPAYPYCDFFLWRDEASVGGEHSPSARSIPADAQNGTPSRPRTPTLIQRPLTSFGICVTPNRRRHHQEAETEEAAGDLSDRGSIKTDTFASASIPARVHDGMGTTLAPTPSKRKRNALNEHDDDPFGDLGPDEERQLVQLADMSVENVRREWAVFATPCKDRTIDENSTGQPTPSVSRTLFPPSNSKRQKTVSFEEAPNRPQNLLTPTKTPTSRADPPPNPFSSPSEAVIPDITEDVMALLKSQNIDPSALQSVRRLLEASARRWRGVVLGRDSARAALKKKDESIARLQERVAALENKDKFHGRQLTNIKAQLMKMYEDN